MKRTHTDEDHTSAIMKKVRLDQNTYTSEAAKFNNMVLRKLEKVYDEDPEDNLLARFPSEYSLRLAAKIRATQNHG